MILQEDVEFLAHYGKKGMKWGVVKEDKGSGDEQAKRDAKAKKYTDKAEGIDKKLSDLSGKKGIKVRREARELRKEKAKALNAADAKRQGKLTQKEKRILVGVGVTAGIIAGTVAYSTLQSGEGNRKLTQGKNFLLGIKGPGWKTDMSLAQEGMGVDDIMSKVVSKINPDYGQMGTKQNCRRCTFAYELRRRGLDVTATKTTNAHGQTLVGLVAATTPDNTPVASGKIASTYKAAVGVVKSNSGEASDLGDIITKGGGIGRNLIEQDEFGSTSPNAIFKALRGQPNGSRGELGVMWGIGGGHSLAYEIIGGKPVIFDTQSGKVFKTPNAFKKAFGEITDVSQAAYTRLDDLPLNDDFLTRWVKNA